jgi:hypothetical protein
MMLGPDLTVDVCQVGAMAVVAPHGEVGLAERLVVLDDAPGAGDAGTDT